MLVSLNKQKDLSFHKVPTLLIKAWLENLQQLSLLMSNSSNSPNSRSARIRYKMLQMACLIRQAELLHLCLKEYLGVFRVLRSFIRLCKSGFVYLYGHCHEGPIIQPIIAQKNSVLI